MKKFWEDFKKFASKGNIIDMAVGVVIGTAFGKIVSSFVSDVITPLISLLTGSVNLTDLKLVMRHAVLDSEGNILKAEVALTYGNFIQSIIDFLIIALSIFLFLRIVMNMKNKFEAAKAKILQEEKDKQEDEAEKEENEEPKPSDEILLLSEIRDLIKHQAEEKE